MCIVFEPRHKKMAINALYEWWSRPLGVQRRISPAYAMPERKNGWAGVTRFRERSPMRGCGVIALHLMQIMHRRSNPLITERSCRIQKRNLNRPKISWTPPWMVRRWHDSTSRRVSQEHGSMIIGCRSSTGSTACLRRLPTRSTPWSSKNEFSVHSWLRSAYPNSHFVI